MSTYRQRIDRLARCHLAFAVANCALNPRFATVTVGSCGDSWKLWRVAGEASNMMENAVSILNVIFFVELQQTEISERKLFIFHLRSLLKNQQYNRGAIREASQEWSASDHTHTKSWQNSAGSHVQDTINVDRMEIYIYTLPNRLPIGPQSTTHLWQKHN